MGDDKQKQLKAIPPSVILRARSEFNQVAQLRGNDTINREELAVLFKELGLEKVRFNPCI